MIPLFPLSFPINFFGLTEDSIYCSHSARSWSRVSAMPPCISKFCIYCQSSPGLCTSICPNSELCISSIIYPAFPHTNEQLRGWKSLLSWCPLDHLLLPQDLRHCFFHSELLSGQYPNSESGSSRHCVLHLSEQE